MGQAVFPGPVLLTIVGDRLAAELALAAGLVAGESLAGIGLAMTALVGE